MTSRALITPRTRIQNAVMNAAAKLDSLKMVSDSWNENTACENNIGSYVCKCSYGDGFQCENVNECKLSPCDENATCQDTLGSYNCQCNDGFDDDGFSCVEVNKCTILNSRQHQFATCSNTLGSYTCKYNSEFKGDGYNCDNIDECELEIIIVSLILNFTIPSDHILVNAILDSLVIERLMITSTSVRIQDSMEPIRFALMNQVVTNVTVT